MTRENAEQKGKRYLTEGRLTVVRVDGDFVHARCRGGGSVYELGHDPVRREWRCGCPARTDRCAHLTALRLICALDGAA